MVRTQLYLDENLHGRLKTIAQKQGRTVSDLAREALALVYLPTQHTDERLATIEEMDGLWSNRDDSERGGAYVRRLRIGKRRRKLGK